MNRAFTVAGVIALASTCIWVGCGDSGSGEGGSGGSGGDPTGATSSSKASSSTAKSTGVTSSSSSQASSSVGSAGCDAPAMPPSMGMCVTLTAGAGGGGGGGGEPGIECNPVTNEPCDTAAGEACDFNGSANAFACFGDNTANLCEECDQQNIFCFGGLTCDTEAGLCAKYCCTDADCGTGTCQPLGSTSAPMLGVCSLP